MTDFERAMHELATSPGVSDGEIGTIKEGILRLAQPERPVFDHALFQWMLDEEARIHKLYGPRMTRVSGCEPLVRWFMRQFPKAEPGVTPVTMVGIPVSIDDDVPLDSLRLTYADGTHRDVRVIGAGDD